MQDEEKEEGTGTNQTIVPEDKLHPVEPAPEPEPAPTPPPAPKPPGEQPISD